MDIVRPSSHRREKAPTSAEKREEIKLYMDKLVPWLTENGFIKKGNAFYRIYGDGIFQGVEVAYERICRCMDILFTCHPDYAFGSGQFVNKGWQICNLVMERIFDIRYSADQGYGMFPAGLYYPDIKEAVEVTVKSFYKYLAPYLSGSYDTKTYVDNNINIRPEHFSYIALPLIKMGEVSRVLEHYRMILKLQEESVNYTLISNPELAPVYESGLNYFRERIRWLEKNEIFRFHELMEENRNTFYNEMPLWDKKVPLAVVPYKGE